MRISMIGGIATISILNRECVLMPCLEWHSHNLHFETCVCLLMSMLGGEEWEDLLGYKKIHISIIIQMSSEST